MTLRPDQLAIEQTTHWIRSFVIELNLCPFARREMEKGSVRMLVSKAKTFKDAVADLKTEFEIMDKDSGIETAFLIFTSLANDFFDYLDFVDEANASLLIDGYEGVYQLATFHPDYCFADTTVDDVTNYTNRSPYPMVHILREENVERAIAAYGNTDKIPDNNMACLRKLGLEKIKKILNRVC